MVACPIFTPIRSIASSTMGLFSMPSRFLALLAIFIGFYVASRFELHKTPAVLESLKVSAAAFSAVYNPIRQTFTEKNPQLVTEKEGSQQAFTSVTPSSGSTRAPYTRHIVAVGDLHGDMKNAQTVLQFSGVVDEFGNWTGDADFFVQTGGMFCSSFLRGSLLNCSRHHRQVCWLHVFIEIP
jgi:hypothetical protein